MSKLRNSYVPIIYFVIPLLFHPIVATIVESIYFLLLFFSRWLYKYIFFYSRFMTYKLRSENFKIEIRIKNFVFDSIHSSERFLIN